MFAHLWQHGKLEVYDDPEADHPKVTFTPDDAPMLRALADELESRAAEYEEYQREQAAEREGEQEEPELTETPEPAAPPKPPVTVMQNGKPAGSEVQKWALR